MRTFHFLAMAACLMMTTASPIQAAEPEKALTTEQALAVMEEFRLKTLEYFETIQQPLELLKSSVASKTLSDKDAYYSALILSEVTLASFAVSSLIAANGFYEAKLALKNINGVNYTYDDGYQAQAGLRIVEVSENTFSHLKFISDTESKYNISMMAKCIPTIATQSSECVEKLTSQKHANLADNIFLRYKALSDAMENIISLSSKETTKSITEMYETYSPGRSNDKSSPLFLGSNYWIKLVESYALSIYSLRSLYGALDVIDTFKEAPPERLNKIAWHAIIEGYNDDVTLVSGQLRDECSRPEMKYLHAECRKLLEVMIMIDATRKVLFEGISRN